MVAVTDGTHMMEEITRAKTHLAVVLVGGQSIVKDFKQAAEEGLAEQIKLK